MKFAKAGGVFAGITILVMMLSWLAMPVEMAFHPKKIPISFVIIFVDAIPVISAIIWLVVRAKTTTLAIHKLRREQPYKISSLAFAAGILSAVIYAGYFFGVISLFSGAH